MAKWDFKITEEKSPDQDTPTEDKTNQAWPDDKGHLPQTEVPVKTPGVNEGQLEDKGTPVTQELNPPAEHTAPIEERTQVVEPLVARAAQPTREDTPAANDPPQVTQPEEQKTPQKLAREQSERLKGSLEQKEKQFLEEQIDLRKTQEHVREHRRLVGSDDGAIPGSRSGNPLENISEDHLGDKVHNVLPEGNRLETQSADKSISVGVLPIERTSSVIRKRKVSLLFPGINPSVSQKELSIYVTPRHSEGWEAPKTYYPPDVPNIELLLPLDSRIHVELVHLDQNGGRSHPYLLTFYTDPGVAPAPLEPSPIGYVLMEEVMTTE